MFNYKGFEIRKKTIQYNQFYTQTFVVFFISIQGCTRFIEYVLCKQSSSGAGLISVIKMFPNPVIVYVKCM